MRCNLLILGVVLVLGSCDSKSVITSIDYKPFSRSTIELQIQEKPIDTLYIEAKAITNVPEDLSESELLAIGGKGTYYLNLEIDRPVVSTLSIGDSIFNVILLPEDTTLIELQILNGKFKLQFKGNGREVNDYLRAKRVKLGYRDLRNYMNNWITSNTKYSQVLSKFDSFVKNEIDFLDQYLTNHTLPDWFINYERAETEYTGAGFKLAIPLVNETFGLFDDTIPSNYYDFLSSVEIDNGSAFLSSRYYDFLDDYFGRDFDRKELNRHTGYARLSTIYGFINGKAKQVLSGNVNLIYSQNMFSKIIQRTSDSLKIDSLAKEFGISDMANFAELVGRDAKGNRKFRDLKIGDQVMEVFCTNEIDSLVSIREFYDKVIYINFWTTWCGPCIANIPEYNKVVESYSNDGRIVFLNICLSSKKDNWKKTLGRTKLRGVNLFAEGNWTEKLTSEFNIKSFPKYVLVDRQNKLFENDTDKAKLMSSTINNLLANSSKKP